MWHIYFATEKSFKSSKLAKTTSLSSFDWLVEKEEAFYLHSLGPNSASMGQLSKDFKLLPAQTSDGWVDEYQRGLLDRCPGSSTDIKKQMAYPIFSTLSVFIFFYIFNNGNLVNLIRLISFVILCFVFSCTQPFLEAASLWSRVAITEQAVAANLPPGFLTSPHVIVPDLEYSLKVWQYKTTIKGISHSLLFLFKAWVDVKTVCVQVKTTAARTSPKKRLTEQWICPCAVNLCALHDRRTNNVKIAEDG